MHSTLGKQQLVEYKRTQISNGNFVIEKRNTELVLTPIGGQMINVPVATRGPWIAITSPEINIEKFRFYVDGTSGNDGVQPNVIIKVEGVASIPDGTTVPFSIQTYLSQRTPEPFVGT